MEGGKSNPRKPILQLNLQNRSRNQIRAPRFSFSKFLLITIYIFFGQKGGSRKIVIGNKEIPYVVAHSIFIYSKSDVCCEYDDDVTHH